jgi:hypothetical protein
MLRERARVGTVENLLLACPRWDFKVHLDACVTEYKDQVRTCSSSYITRCWQSLARVHCRKRDPSGEILAEGSQNNRIFLRRRAFPSPTFVPLVNLSSLVGNNGGGHVLAEPSN